jgi:hypothetical protein
MIADNPIVDPRATVEVAFLGSGALNRVGDLFYILNARVKLRSRRVGVMNAAGTLRGSVSFNESFGGTGRDAPVSSVSACCKRSRDGAAH